jgi:hypothetical protein
MTTKRKPKIDTDIPAAVKLILDDYQAFLAGGPHAQEDGATKAFAARHAAARAALAHLEQLLKLAGDDPPGEAVTESITKWRALMPPEAKEEPEADDDGAGG